jgi:hypothetical protein
MSRTGISSSYLGLILLVIRGFRNTYPISVRKSTEDDNKETQTLAPITTDALLGIESPISASVLRRMVRDIETGLARGKQTGFTALFCDRCEKGLSRNIEGSRVHASF